MQTLIVNLLIYILFNSYNDHEVQYLTIYLKFRSSHENILKGDFIFWFPFFKNNYIHIIIWTIIKNKNCTYLYGVYDQFIYYVYVIIWNNMVIKVTLYI